MHSIRRHVLIWVMGAFGFGVVLLAIAVYAFTMEEMSEVFDEELKQIALSVLTHHQTQPTNALDVQTSRPDVDDIAFITQVWTPEGRLLFTSLPESTLAFARQSGWTTVETTSGEWRVYTAHSASSVAQAAQPISARQLLAADIAIKILIPGLIAVPAFALLLAFALARGLLPLSAATRDVGRRSEQSLQPIDADDLPLEIKPLVSAINSLMSRVDEALSSQRRFVADAAHELRTPLTALKLQARMLAKANNPDRRRDAVAELQNGIDRATHLVSQLLELSRLEPGSSVRAALATPLGEAAKGAVAQFVAQAEKRGIDLGADVSPEVANHLACLAPHEASILLNNLVDNALRYTPPGGRIDVAVRELPDSSRLELVVRDSGPGVDATERSRVFDRFFRGSAAHNNPEIQGTGLGLAIVKSIVDMCGASATLEHGLPNANGGYGLAVRITFKRAS